MDNNSTSALAFEPEPAVFLEAAHLINAVPAQCIEFEDAPFGIEAACRAGMRAVAVCTAHTAAQLAGPHVLAAQLAGPHALTAVHNYNQLIDSQFLDSQFLEGQHHVP